MTLAVSHHIFLVGALLFTSLFATIVVGLGIIVTLLTLLSALCKDRTKQRKFDRAARFWTRVVALHGWQAFAGAALVALELALNWSPFWHFAGGVLQPACALAAGFACLAGLLWILLAKANSNQVEESSENRVAQATACVPLARRNVPEPGATNQDAPAAWGRTALASGAALCSLAAGALLVAADAWLQHPVGFSIEQNDLRLRSFRSVLLNPYALPEYLHTFNGAMLVAAFLLGGAGCWRLRRHHHREDAAWSLRIGVVAGLLCCMIQIFPSGSGSAAMVARHQPITFAAIEGQFHAPRGSAPAVLGLPDSRLGILHHPVQAPAPVRQLMYGMRRSPVPGLASHARDLWPPVRLTWACYHCMALAGLLSFCVLLAGGVLLCLGRLETSAWFHRVLLLALPLPPLANQAGWIAAELGRMPWLVHGFMLSTQGTTPGLSIWPSVLTLWVVSAAGAVLLVTYILGLRHIIQDGPEMALPSPLDSPATWPAADGRETTPCGEPAGDAGVYAGAGTRQSGS